MTPELRAAIDRLPDGMRQEVATLLEEGERAKAGAMFEDMGYDECDVCQQARFRVAFRLRGIPRMTSTQGPQGD